MVPKAYIGKKRLAFLVRESLVSDIPAGDGKTANLFYSVVESSREIGRSKTNLLIHGPVGETIGPVPSPCGCLCTASTNTQIIRLQRLYMEKKNTN